MYYESSSSASLMVDGGHDVRAQAHAERRTRVVSGESLGEEATQQAQAGARLGDQWGRASRGFPARRGFPRA